MHHRAIAKTNGRVPHELGQSGCVQRLEQHDLAVRVGGRTVGAATADHPQRSSAARATLPRDLDRTCRQLVVAREAVGNHLFADRSKREVVDMLGEVEEGLHGICVTNPVGAMHRVLRQVERERCTLTVGPTGLASRFVIAWIHGLPHRRSSEEDPRRAAAQCQRQVGNAHCPASAMKRERRRSQPIDALEQPDQNAVREEVPAFLITDLEWSSSAVEAIP